MNLQEIIGLEALKKLSAEFGGECIYIPTLRHIEMDERNKIISHQFTEMLEGGSTCMNAYECLSKETELSVRRIQQIVNE